MNHSLDTAEARLIRLAQAICQEDPIAASAVIEEGLPLSGRKLSFPLPDGSYPTPPNDIPESWMSEGLSPLTWVVGRMLEITKGESSGMGGSNSMVNNMLGLPSTGSGRAKNYGSEIETSLEALSQIGGSLLAAGVSPDTRMGRTARSQKAIEALKFRLPEYALAFQSSANRRLLQEIQRKSNPTRQEVDQEPYRPKM